MTVGLAKNALKIPSDYKFFKQVVKSSNFNGLLHKNRGNPKLFEDANHAHNAYSAPRPRQPKIDYWNEYITGHTHYKRITPVGAALAGGFYYFLFIQSYWTIGRNAERKKNAKIMWLNAILTMRVNPQNLMGYRYWVEDFEKDPFYKHVNIYYKDRIKQSLIYANQPEKWDISRGDIGPKKENLI